MKKKGKVILSVIAIATAVIGGAVAIATFLKRKAKVIREELDFDPNIYLEDDEFYNDQSNDEYSAQEDYEAFDDDQQVDDIEQN